MNHSFWESAWAEGRTHFHRATPHDMLVRYFPPNRSTHQPTVLVPLCGKTTDMDWLRQQGAYVIGIELVESAVQAFFIDHQYPEPRVHSQNGFTVYSTDNLEIWCGDFFNYYPTRPIDIVYDRAAIVALPSDLRERYATTLTQWLPPASTLLMVTFDYPQQSMSGPPFSVSESEIQRLFGDAWGIKLLEIAPLERENQRLMAVPNIRQGVYILEKRALVPQK